MDGILLGAMIIGGFYGIVGLLINSEGTKGIEKEPYYGRKTGTLYTAKKDREKYIV